MFEKILAASTLWLACASVFSGAAAAEKKPPENANPWESGPSYAQILAAWPSTAQNVDGRVVVECTPNAERWLGQCRIVNESPAGVGFGAPALQLATRFRLRAGAVVDSPNPGTVRALVPFQRPFDSNPDWLRRPTPEDLLSVWPANQTNKGRAVISCIVDIAGVLRDCAVLSETPAGGGFGQAAMALTPQLMMRPALRAGKPVHSFVSIPITFSNPPGRFGATKIVTAAQVWTKAPTYTEMVAAYPTKARQAQAAGHVNLHCLFTAAGTLTSCQTINEEPKGKGFATAAKQLAKSFQFTSTVQGEPVKGIAIQLPFTFSPEMLKDGTPATGKPRWAAVPSADVIASVYPQAAMKARVFSARVMLSCEAQHEGKLSCTVESEEPSSLGFGEAALKIAPYFRLHTWTIEGLPTVGAQLRVPIRFESGEPTESAAATPPPAKP